MKIKKYSEPPFWQDVFINKEPNCQNLINNFHIIKQESLRLKKIANLLFDKYSANNPKLPKKNNYFIEKDVNWKIAPIFGSRYDVNAKRRASQYKLWKSDILSFFVRLLCPKTTSLLRGAFKKKIILNAYFTQLSPNSIIKPHYHPVKNGIHRMNLHLGIVCDPDAKITVGEETKTWEEGKILAFKNSGPYRHSVVHNGTHDRLILIVELDVKYLEKYGVFKGERIYD